MFLFSPAASGTAFVSINATVPLHSTGIAQEWTIVDVKAQAAGPPQHLELPFFHRKTLSENSKSGGVAAQDLIAFGNKARRGQFPYIASLLKSSSSGAGFYHSCTGTLIAPTLILTAGKHSEYYFIYIRTFDLIFSCIWRSLITSPQCTFCRLTHSQTHNYFAFCSAAHCFFDVATGAWSPPTLVLLGGVDLSSSNNFRESMTPVVRSRIFFFIQSSGNSPKH